MALIKISEATRLQLNWMVAKCEGEPFYYNEFDRSVYQANEYLFEPSTDWSQGGPIIEREGISLLYLYVTDDPFRWAATQKPNIRKVKPDSVYGPTLLVAAMRCYVASKLGDEVEIPEELK